MVPPAPDWRGDTRHHGVVHRGGGGSGCTVARAQEEDLRRDALRVNVYATRQVAGTVLFALKEYADAIEHGAEEPALVTALQTRDAVALGDFCKRHLNSVSPGGSSFVMVFVQDTTGRIIARGPETPREILDKDFGWRDYFEGARRLALRSQHTAYLSRAFLAEADGYNAFALSAPVYAPDGTWLGVLVGTVAADSTLGSLRLDDSNESHRTAILVAPPDRSRGGTVHSASDELVVLVHERLSHGRLVPLPKDIVRQLAATPFDAGAATAQLLMPASRGIILDRYRDPVTGDAGPWLAASAPVGNTGFSVIVQTRENAVLAVKPPWHGGLRGGTAVRPGDGAGVAGPLAPQDAVIALVTIASRFLKRDQWRRGPSGP